MFKEPRETPIEEHNKANSDNPGNPHDTLDNQQLHRTVWLGSREQVRKSGVADAEKLVESEEMREAAITKRNAEAKDQFRRLTWIGMTALSYGIDTLFLALFAMAGTISWTVALVYGSLAALISVSVYGFIAAGWNMRLRDPSLIEPQMILAVVMQLGIVMVVPEVTFPFITNLFTVFGFGMNWLSLRDSVVVWTLGIFGTAAVFYAAQGHLGLPASNTFELVLVWLYFALILARCLLLSVNANKMRERLADSRSKLAASLEQVRLLADHDELTGSLNRRSLMVTLERERVRAERSNVPFSIAMIDLDHFKRVNDTHGHAAGDEVLRGLAATARQSMRGTDEFGRYGGEEFLLILVGTSIPLAQEGVERIRKALAKKDWSLIAPDFSVTLSAGVATHRKGETIEQLLRRADMALYQAKDAGRDTIIASPL